jgi:hypothetical protein
MVTDRIITANWLQDGAVIWMTDSLGWSIDRSVAGIFSEARFEQARGQAVLDEQNNLVTAVYEIVIDGKAEMSMREQIRANQGPTVAPPSDSGPHTQMTARK